jgi:hypothetical protein
MFAPLLGKTFTLFPDTYRTRAAFSRSETANTTLAFLEPFTVVGSAGQRSGNPTRDRALSCGG